MQQWGAIAIGLVACSGNQEHPNCRTRSHALLDLGWRLLSRTAPCAGRRVFRCPAPRCRCAISPLFPHCRAGSGTDQDACGNTKRPVRASAGWCRQRPNAKGSARDRTNPRRLSGSAAGDGPAASRASSDGVQRHHCRRRGGAPRCSCSSPKKPHQRRRPARR